MGWQVLTIWECQTRDLRRLSKRLVEFLSKSSASHKKSKFSPCEMDVS